MKAQLHLGGKRGVSLLQDPLLNKGTAFSQAERDALGLTGLLPPCVNPAHVQISRTLENLRSYGSDIEKYVFLAGLLDTNETLFYRLAAEHLSEIMPLIYTPTVGEACRRFGHVFNRPRGLFISANDSGRVRQILENWPTSDVRIIVVTDGERILGLGDLGAGGMGIPIGKLSLYTACAGVPPAQCLPITLDVGTDNEELLNDPLYLGIPQMRLRGAAYENLLEEFMSAVAEVFPKTCVQFEDFGNANAFRLLSKYRDRACCFNDDIQGTAAVILAGLLSAMRIAGRELRDSKILFLGAGEAGLGAGDLISDALQSEGLSASEARARCWFVDSKGLVVAGRAGLSGHKERYAHPAPARAQTLLEAVEMLKPAAIVGVAGQAGTFTRDVIEAMARHNPRPIVFALSNPTSKAECTAAQAYEWSGGRAIVATGSPFPPFEHEGRTLVPGQGNNAYVFPGVGLGLIAARATRVTNAMFQTAARTLADSVSPAGLARGLVYPPLDSIRQVSHRIARAVAGEAFASNLTRIAPPDDLDALIRSATFNPEYASVV
jgi:malate dehydrogenase (oxaloacetate-decarboxylating)(NADP+)